MNELFFTDKEAVQRGKAICPRSHSEEAARSRLGPRPLASVRAFQSEGVPPLWRKLGRLFANPGGRVTSESTLSTVVNLP